ncbi:MAG TPA: response regulator [Burkholderiaceae bacterium]|nr:response regulator [Burkholderiaceae bacterium]
MGTIEDRIAPLAVAVAALEERLARARAEPAADRAAAEARCREMQQAVVRFGAQAGAAGASGLAHAAEWLSANLEYLAHKQRDLLPEEDLNLRRWPRLASEYVAGPTPQQDAAKQLIQFAELPVWVLRPSPVGSASILSRLCAFQSPERNAVAAAAALEPEAAQLVDAETVVATPIEVFPEPMLAVSPQPEAAAQLVDVETVVATPVEFFPEPAPTLSPREQLDAALNALAAAASELAAASSDRRDQAVMAFATELLTVVEAAQGAEVVGLGDVCGLLLERVEAARALASLTEAVPPDWLLPALDFAALAHEFGAAPGEHEIAANLLACLQHPSWPNPLDQSEAATLRIVLGLPAAIEQVTALPVIEEPESGVPEQQQIDPEHLALLAGEFPAMLAAMRADLDAARNDATALEVCADVFERGANAAEVSGLVALRHVLAHVAERVRAAAPRLSNQQHAWLSDFPQRVRAYLATPMDPSAAAAMIESLFEGGAWMALAPQRAADLEQALYRVALVTASGPERAQEATAEQVSLAVPADINPELLDGLLAELPVQTADFAAAMQRVASGAASMFDLDVAKRAAHTLKGAAHTVGVQGIANLTHHIEDILIALTRHGRMPQRDLAEALIGAADCLEAMSEALLGVGPTPHDAQQTLQHLLDWANRIDAEGLPEDDDPAPPVVDAVDVQANAAPASALPPADPHGASEPNAPAENLLRLPASLVDELLRLVGETMIANTQIKEQLRLTVEHTRAVTRQNTALQDLASELEQLVDVRGVTAPLGVAKGHGDFDALEFDHYNELHTVSRRLIEAATDSRELSRAGEQRLATLAELLDGQGRLAIENQKVVMKTRMVPASSVVSRLQRSVRQTARLVDKRVELDITGANTAIDSQVLNGLVDPLMHLLRNAADHGIEDAQVRAARGKPAVGRIELAFAREGTSVVVRVSDDGAGLDLPRIRAKAESRGYLSPGQPATDDEIARLILLPGFSTRDDATQVSGRGIGMDAVHTRVQALKGTLRLLTPPGRGLTVELRLPASLMTTHGLLVRHNDQVLAISSYGIHDIRYVTRDQVRALGSGQIYQDQGKVYELRGLDTLIGRSAHSDERDWFPALLVQADSGPLRAVRVQEVLDSQEVVVKSLGRYVPRLQGAVGVTILGDGSIAPVLDLPQLLRGPQRAARVATAASTTAAVHSPVESRRSALVVDDSLSARRAAAQFMRDAGFSVRSAIDGIEAAALIEKQVPDIVLVDMEMPRMNGLEFTTHVRSREATRHVPIIMITSRSTEKHRRQAEAVGVNVYLTKPFSDDELLDHVERLTASAPIGS